jgi:UPF0716 protein FxsA
VRFIPAAVLALVVAEIVVLVLLAQAIGAGATFGVLVLHVLVGSWLLRREGRRTVREVTEAARLRRPPERGLGDGVITAAGGILVMVPGLITDLAALCCLLPFTRKALRTRIERAAERRSQAAHASMGAGGFPGAAAGWAGSARGPSARSGSADDVIDGEVISVDEEDEGRSDHRGQRPLGRSAQEERPPDGPQR